MKRIKIILFLTLAISFIAMIIFVLLLAFHVDCKLDSMWSTLVSIFASLFFSTLVSAIVQKINDDREARSIISMKNSVRDREIEKLTIYINSFISTYHDCETELISQYDFMTDCFNNGQLDLDVIVQNLCFAEELIKHEDSKHLLNKIDDYMINSQSMRNEYNKMVNLINECAAQFNLLNDTYRLPIFEEDEITALKIVLPIENKEIMDIVQVKFYLSNLFDIIEKFNISLNIYVNYEWLVVASILMETLNEDSLEKEKDIASSIVKNYIDNINK